MGDQRWEKVKRIFEEGLDCPRGEREAFLERACGEDRDLRASVEALLSSDDDESDFLKPQTRGAALALINEVMGEKGGRVTTVGKYRLDQVIASGGMGTVYAANRTDGYDQKVAVKLIRAGMATDDILERFMRERQTLAKLEHPNIARLLDGGASDNGSPYLVMEFIDGQPIDTYCDDHKLSIHQRLDVFHTACKAVQFAHRNLVVHRDLKPSNMLVAPDGTLKLVDFGISKILTGDDHTGSLTATDVTQQLMTPQYASPEQFRGESITTATDVYSLGVVLYELLSGTRPYEIKGRKHSEAERLICETEPAPPSTAVTRPLAAGDVDERAWGQAVRAISQNRNTPIDKLSRQMRGDLDTIVLTAMHHDPDRRYDSVEHLAEDIDRYVNGLPIRARRDSFGYRMSKFVGRHKLGVAAAILLLLSIVAGSVGTTIGFVRTAAALERAEDEAERATQEALKAERITLFIQDMLAAADPYDDKSSITVREVLDQTASRVDSELREEPKVLAAVHHTLGRTYASLGDVPTALEHLRKALEIRTDRYGPDDAHTAASMDALAGVLIDSGGLDEGRAYVDQAYAIMKGLGLHESAGAVGILNNRAKYYQASGQLDDAEVEFQACYDLCVREFGELHANTMHALNNLAAVYAKQSDYENAEAMYSLLIERSEKLYGESDPWTLAYANNLAVLYMRQQRFAEAEEIYRRIVDGGRAALGEDHPRTLKAMSNLAYALAAQNEPTEAEELYVEVLGLRQRVLSASHPDTLATVGNLAQLYKALGRYDEAETLLRTAAEHAREGIGVEHPATLDTLNDLALVLTDLGRFDEAEPLNREILDVSTREFGENDERTLDYLENLAILYVKRNRMEDAETYFRSLIDRQSERLGAGHARVLRLRANLAFLFLKEDEFEKAHELLEPLVDEYERSGDHSTSSMVAINNLARAKLGLGDAEAAADLLQNLVDDATPRLGTDSWHVAIFKSFLGESLVRLNRMEDAERVLLESHEVLAGNQASLGRARTVADKLADLYRQTDRPDEAATWAAKGTGDEG